MKKFSAFIVSKRNHLILLITILLFVFVSLFKFNFQTVAKTPQVAGAITSTRIFTSQELQKYDGTNPDLPIYLALEGLIYDVSEGKEFYSVGGSYHYLAGKDSTKELRLFGGEIIKRKYPVIGKLTR